MLGSAGNTTAALTSPTTDAWLIIGSAITGGFGAYSATQNGGDISKGVLFGAATGAATGALNGADTNAVNFASSVSFWEGVGNFSLRIGAGAIAGAAGGSTVRYAGGAGSGNDIMHGAFHGAIVGVAMAGALTGIDAFEGIPFTYGGDSASKITILGAPTVQEVTQNPIISSLAISGASGYDVLTNSRLSDFILRKAGKKGGHGSCSGTFDDAKCGIGLGAP